MRKSIAAIALSLFLIASSVFAFGYNYVAPSDFKKWLETKKSMQVVDIQVPGDFQKQHFQNSIQTNAYPVKSSDDKKKLDKVIPQLAASKDDVVIVCPRGGGGAKNTYDYLKDRGIPEKRLFILERGMQGWQHKELTVGGNIAR